MLKHKLPTSLIVGTMALVGLVAGVATMAGAQSQSVTATGTATDTLQSQTIDTPEPSDVPDTINGTKPKRHAPLGGDGVVSSINGTLITIGEESDEGGASYTIDASKATVTNEGASRSLSDIKIGDKIFVQGVTNGTNVSATSISLGRPGGHMEKVNDTDGNGASEASEPAGSSDASDK